MVDVTIPSAGESVTDVRIGSWTKKEGDFVDKDEVLVEIETDKASFEIPAPASGRVSDISAESGDDARPGEVIARIDTDAARPDQDAEDDNTDADQDASTGADEDADAADGASARADDADADDADADDADAEDADADDADADKPDADDDADADDADADDADADDADAGDEANQDTHGSPHVTPSARRVLREHDIDPCAADLPPSVSKPDALRQAHGLEEKVRMSPLRRAIAERLSTVQNEAALLTTFNEIDMSGVIELRERFGEDFERKHGVRLGIMSFFVKAAVEALKRHPALNAEVRGEEIVFKRHYDIAVAVGTDRGLVVPVLRQADRMSLAEIEGTIADLAERAQAGTLEPNELEGGTFTLSNGGVYGSLLSQPIVNPPQSGILGMHAIQDRPVARDGEVVIRPMMYVALTYDHRVADGQDSVRWLTTLKACVETPARILLEL